MGWASANPIFDRTAQELLNKHLPDDVVTDVLAVLIDELRDSDWDTDGESWEEFKQYPSVRAAFAKAMPRDYTADGPIPWDEQEDG